jgi:branched-chain amino acid transport system substrate-binding protein
MKRFIVPLLAAVMVVSIIFAGCMPTAAPSPVTPPEEAGEVNIGFLCALTGADAGWGLPGVTGNQLFIDKVNAEGGLLVGGKRYKINMILYDDEASGSKALTGARYLVMEKDVKFINSIGGQCADSTHPFLTEHKVFYAPLISGDIRPDRPYLIGGGDANPRGDMARTRYIREHFPNAKRWAETSQDDIGGYVTSMYEVGGAVANGFDIVYNKYFDLATTDFAPIISAILATKPDVISWGNTYPTYVTMLYEQCYLQGYEGVITCNYIDYEATLARVPKEYLHATYGIDGYPEFDDPWWDNPKLWEPDGRQHQFYEDWMARFGPGAPDDVGRRICPIDWDHVVMTEVWAHGAQIAGTFDPDAILAALKAEPYTPTILGPGIWWGTKCFGNDNIIQPPTYICEANADGVRRIVDEIDFPPYYETIHSTVRAWMEEYDIAWWQKMGLDECPEYAR